MKLTISKGNNKLGAIPNSSLVPIKDCVNCAACARKCYAMKAYRLYPNVKKAWDGNSKLLHKDPYKWAFEHIVWIKDHKPDFFRLMQAGDVVSLDHFRFIRHIVLNCPDTKFLLFTKAFNFIQAESIPKNLQVVLSMFPSMKLPPRELLSLPIAWAYTTESDYPSGGNTLGYVGFKNAVECPGNCEGCGMCWNLGKLNTDVKFKIH